MRYVGGKARIVSWVEEHLVSVGDGCVAYLEPFVGGGAVFARMAPRFEIAIAADAHADLILMWKAIANGWVPPGRISKSEYVALRESAMPSAMRGFAGFGSSFSGKWFGGYVDISWDKCKNRYTNPYAKAAQESLLKVAPAFAKATAIVRRDFQKWNPGSGILVYCDPPYVGTLGYGVDYDHVEFWNVAGRWADSGAIVVVSENVAPDGWVVIAERTRKATLRVAKGGENLIRRECLYMKRIKP